MDGVHMTPDVLVGLGKTMKLSYVGALSAAPQRPDFMIFLWRVPTTKPTQNPFQERVLDQVSARDVTLSPTMGP